MTSKQLMNNLILENPELGVNLALDRRATIAKWLPAIVKTMRRAKRDRRSGSIVRWTTDALLWLMRYRTSTWQTAARMALRLSSPKWARLPKKYRARRQVYPFSQLAYDARQSLRNIV